MIQLDFFLSEVERVQFIQYCFGYGCNIIPNQHYDRNKYTIITSMGEYQQYCKRSPFLFITSNKFSTYPLELDYFEVGEGKKYYIKQRHGGPTIDFFSPIVGEIEDNIVGPGYIGIYPFYYRNNMKYVPNKSLMDFYKIFTMYIKEICQKIKLTERVFWIGKHTIEKAKKGEIELLPISNINLLTMI